MKLRTKEIELPDIDREYLIQEARKVSRFADDNLAQLDGLLKEHEDIQNYFLGMIRRQTILLNDLAVVLEQSLTKNITTPFLICRCLCDDFLHVFYLELHGKDDDIIRINAEAHQESFKSLNWLSKSNVKHFEEKYPYYPTRTQYEDLKRIFVKKPENGKYFEDISSFKFKRFLQLRQLAEKIEDFELSKYSSRAYFLWTSFSEFIHFSSLTLPIEMYNDHEQQNFRMIEETILNAFNTVELSFRFFSDKLKLNLKVDSRLFERYAFEYD